MNNHFYFKDLIRLAGLPKTNESSGMFFVTTEPAPTTEFTPILTFGKIVALVPMNTLSPISQFPEIPTLGQISVNAPIDAS